MNDLSRQSWPERDVSGHLSGHGQPCKIEPHFSLDLYQVASLFDTADIARNRRSLSRYCTKGKLDCEKVETLNGEEWRIDEQSVHRLIAQIEEQQRLTHQDTPGQVPPGHQSEMLANAGLSMSGHAQTMPDSTSQAEPELAHTFNGDKHGQDGTGEAVSEHEAPITDDRLLMQLERENDLLRDQLEKKDSQIEKKDNQIDDLIQRGREDKLLLQNFQRKLGMLEAPEVDRPRQADKTPLPWQKPLTETNTVENSLGTSDHGNL